MVVLSLVLGFDLGLWSWALVREAKRQRGKGAKMQSGLSGSETKRQRGKEAEGQ